MREREREDEDDDNATMTTTTMQRRPSMCIYKRKTRYPRDSPIEPCPFPIYGSEQTRVYDLTCSDLELPISLDLLIQV